MMLLGFKTELKLNNQQRTQLAKHCGVARHAWNWGLALTKNILDHNKANPEDKIKFPTAVDLHKWLVAMVKPECPWYYEVSKCAPQYALRQLAEAWKQGFKKVKKPPRFKKKGRADSFTVDGSLAVDHFRVKIPVIGWVKTYECLPIDQKPKSFTISRTADRWFVSWKIEVNRNWYDSTPTPDEKGLDDWFYPYRCPVLGVDLGVKTLATLSTGEVFEGAKSYRKYERKLSRLQWLNRNKQRGSNNWKKAKIQIAQLHSKIANIRKDTLHKLTSYLAKNHSKIGIEDLSVSGMLANHKLAKAIADMGFYEFRRQLEYKCELYGSELVVVNRWFASSKTCSNCGTKKETLSLMTRVFECGHCGFTCDRDLNASINLEKAVS
jgi:putative transposase